VVHGGYTPPTSGYVAPLPPRPIIHTYDQAPPPPVVHHSYHPPVHHTYVAPKPAYIPPVQGKGKVCHSTCDDGTTTNYVPSGGVPAPAPVATYTQSSISAVTAAPSGGDRAVKNLQAALSSKGYYTGPDNGLFTQSTMASMVKYQHDNHLAEGRYTGETANSLGISR
jgi:hypothetical protein